MQGSPSDGQELETAKAEVTLQQKSICWTSNLCRGSGAAQKQKKKENYNLTIQLFLCIVYILSHCMFHCIYFQTVTTLLFNILFSTFILFYYCLL